MRLHIWSCLIFALLFLAEGLFGQEYGGSLSGRVLNPSGTAVPAAHLTLTDIADMPGAKGWARGNSGVIILKRYEVQIPDSYRSDMGGPSHAPVRVIWTAWSTPAGRHLTGLKSLIQAVYTLETIE